MIRINDVVIEKSENRYQAFYVGNNDKYGLFFYSPLYHTLSQAIEDVNFKLNLIVRLNKRLSSKFAKQLSFDF